MSTPPNSNPSGPLAPVLIHLLKKVLYQDRDESLFADLLRLQGQVREYFQTIGLELFIDESEGYAFLRQAAQDEDNPDALPRLVQRRSLPYRLSLLIVLLRKRMLELDVSGAETRLILSRKEIQDMVRTFLPESNDQARQDDEVTGDINKLLDYGFLRRLKGDDTRLEVRRILKAVVDADWIDDFENKLQEYREHGAGNA